VRRGARLGFARLGFALGALSLVALSLAAGARPAVAHLALPGAQAMLMAGWDTVLVELDTRQPYASRRFALYVAVRPEHPSAADSLYALDVAAIPGLGTVATPQRGRVVRIAGSSHEWEGDIAIPVRGAWGLQFTVTRPNGATHATNLPVTVAAPNAIPLWAGWCVGLSPLLGLLAFAAWQTRVLRQRLREERAAS